MKIVALERASYGKDIDLSMFKDFGEFEMYDFSTPEEMQERAKDADAIIINKMPINDKTIANLTNLKLVLEAATGFDNVDLNYCKSRGIQVRNAKGYSTDSVVQHTFASLFYVYEKLRYYDEYVKSSEYCNSPIFVHYGPSFNELSGKVWGIVGLGNIGRGVAKVAKSFGCKVVYFSTSGRNNCSEYTRVELDELLQESDIISIHAPLNEVTRNMFNMDTFIKMKKSAILVNMGRGPIVNDKDLVDALNKGEIAGAALDVLVKEPMERENPLLEVKDSNKLIVTPHIAWASVEARNRLMKDVYNNIQSYLDGGDFNLLN